MENAERLRGANLVDRPFHPSYAGLMSLQRPLQLVAKRTRLAGETGRTAAQVALDLLASSVANQLRGRYDRKTRS